MVSSSLRFALLATAIAAATTNPFTAADDLASSSPTDDTLNYDALTYYLEFGVEVIADVAGTNRKLKPALDKFTGNFRQLVTNKSLTLIKYGAELDTFYTEAKRVDTKFVDKVNDTYIVQWCQPIRFIKLFPRATWNLIDYGIIAQKNLSKDISSETKEIENFMNDPGNIPTDDKQDMNESDKIGTLNEKLENFYDSLGISDFEERVTATVKEKIRQATGQTNDPTSCETTPAPPSKTPTSKPSKTVESRSGASTTLMLAMPIAVSIVLSMLV